MEIMLQLHGGGGGSDAPSVKQSAPMSSAAASVSAATAGERQRYQDLLRSARGRNYTNKTQGMGMENSIKKALLGE